MFVIVVVLARVLRKNRSDVKLHIPYLLGKIKLKEICPKDKKKFQNRTDLCPKGKGTNGTLGFMREAHPREIKKFEIHT